MSEFASTDGQLGLLLTKQADLMRAIMKRRFDVSTWRPGKAIFITLVDMWGKRVGTPLLPVDRNGYDVWEKTDTPFDYMEQVGKGGQTGADLDEAGLNNDCRPCMHNGKHGLFFDDPNKMMMTIVCDDNCYIDIDSGDTDIVAKLDAGKVYFCACEDLLNMDTMPYKIVNSSELVYFQPSAGVEMALEVWGSKAVKKSDGGSKKRKNQRDGRYHRTPLSISGRKARESEGATTGDSSGTSGSDMITDETSRLVAGAGLHQAVQEIHTCSQDCSAR